MMRRRPLRLDRAPLAGARVLLRTAALEMQHAGDAERAARLVLAALAMLPEPRALTALEDAEADVAVRRALYEARLRGPWGARR